MVNEQRLWLAVLYYYVCVSVGWNRQRRNGKASERCERKRELMEAEREHAERSVMRWLRCRAVVRERKRPSVTRCADRASAARVQTVEGIRIVD